MSEKSEKKRSKGKSEKKRRKHEDAQSHEDGAVEKADSAVKSSIYLLADETRIDPTLSSLFAAKPTPLTRKPPVSRQAQASSSSDEDGSTSAHERTGLAPVRSDDEPSEQLPSELQGDGGVKRKRRRKGDEDEIEDAYMRRLAREEAKEAELAAAERASKRQKTLPVANGHVDDHEAGEPQLDAAIEHDEEQDEAVEGDMSPPPRHETEQTPDIELAKANRTIFLGNVSTRAISSKSSRKVLIDHLKSFFGSVSSSKAKETKAKVESIRFRSTPYAAAAPKKASFARREVMDATTKSTNAYVVYSSSTLAREAVRHLNGTVILDRHLRVDSIAHPSPIDHRRCVFVGGLSFVDDESNIQDANEEDSKQKRKKPKRPADVEEGLWRTFGKCGNVESVRVIRDSATRVGKGIAYVQFEDGNAVEAALLYDGKKFPPMLPRTLRVSRAKAVKRNQKSGSRMSDRATNNNKRKVINGDASQLGRAKKLFGHAAAMSKKRDVGSGERRPRDSQRAEDSPGVKRPEHFMFEGYRASSNGGKSGLKLGKKKKGGKPTNRSARRGAAFKAGGKK